ncbi:unnamed protein product [Lupinus luteus]|uniref:PH domain-containing protein n=1 Tax=Lupinus luteus TaxID=3873 RepID=A0AAV1XE16_LUPLU
MHSFRNQKNHNEPGSAPPPRTDRSNSSLSSELHHHHHHYMPPAKPSSFRSLSSCSRSTRGTTPSSSSQQVQRSVSARFNRQNTTRGEVVLNDVVGNGISGILYKWVNYGRGWRPRWFILHDGVLSYYKIHGPDKIVLNREVENGFKVIGEESRRRIAGQRHALSRHCKPVSEIHLMVCSIRQNKTDEKRFSIYTGTKKRLHLRAESGEDRTTWLGAMLAVKDMYPRLPNSEIMAPVVSVVISTDKLKQRLLQEGLSETAIKESEDIMRAELSTLHKHITDKVDLENTVVEDQIQSKEEGDSFLSTHEKYSADGSATDSSDEHDRHDHSDDEDAFFDTSDILSTCSSDHIRSCHESEIEDETNPNCICESISAVVPVGFYYPKIKRRNKLPDPVEKENGISLWSIIKDNIGKDLTKGNSFMRMLHVAAFAVSGYASTRGRSCKPFNPLLGETYEADYPDKGIRFISEKVSHHPMIVACHCEGNGWKFWGDSNLKSKFWGRSIQLDPIGVLTLEFDDGEVFHWSKVTTSIYNLILGKLYCEHYGTMRVEGNREYTCKIKFKEQSIIDRNPHQIHGIVEDKKGKNVGTIFGKWDESLHYIIGGNSGKGKGSNVSSKPNLLWKRSPPPEHQTRYNLTQFAITLNEITPDLKDKLPPTDSRLRPDQRCLENGEYEMANAEKLLLEQRQRQARNMQEKGWKPRWFTKDKGDNTYHYVGGYWETRESGNWESCPNIFGQHSSDNDLNPSP